MPPRPRIRTVAKKREVQAKVEEKREKLRIARDKQAVSSQLPNWVYVVTSILCVLGLVAFGHYRLVSLPDPKPATIPDSEFSEERALEHIHSLEAMGERFIGSDALRNGHDYVLQTVKSLRKKAPKNVRMDIYLQEAKGWHTHGHFEKNAIHAYGGISNIIVKVSYGQLRDNCSLLVNSHMDTKDGSPGAADDGLGVGVALEVMNNVVHGQRAENSYVFLFNGGEEVALMGAHGFVESNLFSNLSIVAFMNLEASGNKGKPVVFQVGPNNGWLASSFAQSGPYPLGNSIGQDLFERRFIPSETDFEIFTKAGGIPGIDVATFMHGYTYHTPKDQSKLFDVGMVQAYGDNVLEFLRNVGGIPNLESYAAKHAEEYAIYMDILGFKMFVFSKGRMNLFAVLTLLFTVGLFLAEMNTYRTQGDKPSSTHIAIFAICSILSLLLAVSFASMTAVGLRMLGFGMTWYDSPLLALLVFGLPACCGVVLGQEVARYVAMLIDVRANVLFSSDRIWHWHILSLVNEHAAQWGTVIFPIWLSLLILLVVQSSSMFLFFIMLLFTVAGRAMVYLSFVVENAFGEVENLASPTNFLDWIVFSLLYWVPVVPTISYIFASLVALIIPMSGRRGFAASSDEFVAVFLSLCVFFIAIYLMPLLHRVSDTKFNWKTLLTLFGLGLIVLCGLCIRRNGFSPDCPKRVAIQNTHVHIKDGEWEHFALAGLADNSNIRTNPIGLHLFRDHSEFAWIWSLRSRLASFMILPSQDEIAMMHEKAKEYTMPNMHGTRAADGTVRLSFESDCVGIWNVNASIPMGAEIVDWEIEGKKKSVWNDRKVLIQYAGKPNFDFTIKVNPPDTPINVVTWRHCVDHDSITQHFADSLPEWTTSSCYRTFLAMRELI